MIKLDKRLFAVSQMIPPCNVHCDIGSDHAYLPIFLLKNNIIKKALITDINKGPLANSQKNTQEYGVFDKCEFFLSDGLAKLDNIFFESLSICGMGAETILSVFEKDLGKLTKCSNIVLQPMTHASSLLIFLNTNRFQMDDVRLVKDDYLFYYIYRVHYEETMQAQANNTELNEYDFLYPPILIEKKDATMKEYLLYKLNEQKKISDELKNSENIQIRNNNQSHIDAIEKRLIKYET